MEPSLLAEVELWNDAVGKLLRKIPPCAYALVNTKSENNIPLAVAHVVALKILAVLAACTEDKRRHEHAVTRFARAGPQRRAGCRFTTLIFMMGTGTALMMTDKNFLISIGRGTKQSGASSMWLVICGRAEIDVIASRMSVRRAGGSSSACGYHSHRNG
jgi:hypothetical protein